MAKVQKGLGRGLDALLGGKSEKDEDVLRELNLSLLHPGQYQPRTKMDESSLLELAESIKTQGVIQPILVRQIESHDYEIIAGERRWRAAKLAGLSHVPVLVRSVSDHQALAMALIENIQREDLNPLEEAQGLLRLVEEFGLTHQLAADAVGRSRSAASNLLRLLKLNPEVQAFLMADKIDMGHARALLSLQPADQILVANKVVHEQLSVRETERIVQRILEPTEPRAKAELDADTRRLQEEVSESIGAQVTIQPKAKGRGRLIIDYHDLGQLDELIVRLKNAQ